MDRVLRIPEPLSLLLCYDVHGVLDRLTSHQASMLARFIEAAGPDVACAIVSYQRHDNWWPETARTDSPWAAIVDLARTCVFPNHRPWEQQATHRFSKRPRTPSKFWIFHGSKRELMELTVCKCHLFGDRSDNMPWNHSFTLVPRHMSSRNTLELLMQRTRAAIEASGVPILQPQRASSADPVVEGKHEAQEVTWNAFCDPNCYGIWYVNPNDASDIFVPWRSSDEWEIYKYVDSEKSSRRWYWNDCRKIWMWAHCMDRQDVKLQMQECRAAA